MNASEAKAACDELATLIDNYLFGMNQFFSARDVRFGVTQVQDFATRWQGDFIATPEGSPVDLRTSAADITGQRNLLVYRRSNLLAGANLIEGNMIGQAGHAHATAYRALATQLDFESTGLGILYDGTRAYATALEDGQSAVDIARGALATARASATGLTVPEGDSVVLDQQELDAAWAEVRAVYEAGLAALHDASRGLGAIVDAERAFEAALSDSAGYARLSDVPLSSSVSTLDAILALVDGVGDPDSAIVSDAEWAAYVGHVDALTPAERSQLQEALDAARTPAERQLVVSAFATGAGLTATLGLAADLRTMTTAQVSDLAGLGIAGQSGAELGEDGTRPAVVLNTADATLIEQQTGTTCGSASLLMLAAQRDPFLALFIAEGRLIDGHVPPFIEDLPTFVFETYRNMGTAERMTFLQEELRARTNLWTVWPGVLAGSAPWGYGDEVARALGIGIDMDYSTIHPADNAEELVDAAIVAVDAGTPVPFLVGGVNGAPRHYVVLVGHEGGMLEFYEPGSGMLHSVSVEDAVAGDRGSIPAFGNWTSIWGAGLPAS